ncbi:glutamate ABC transporter substrate-binding protein [Streptomyces celluloflavus]|uniref:Glutamate ABC transporter substrate-binding protein n=2 Tax=Streptomyces TaxID=1883 RepID=A0A4Q9HP43_STRKA|nr:MULTISPECIES: glutamate ABC transporter substrate-binding protein [Streptomyces]MYU52257.1 transporter substrate-binding domain-containing protein [Streptomyces sp. SID7805]TBO56637.1 glutamate ABC transporter substrate-binding protein [Streptomyces kasugaensis]WSK15441.1 glutamate ABC transporter substrate-binding protein [Streptomyces celluloflavus]
MRIRKTAAAGAMVLALTATATACGGEAGTAGDKDTAAKVFSGEYTVAKNVTLNSPVLKKAQERKKIVVGAKADQPFLGFQDTDGKRTGFDIEIAKMVAADLGFSEQQITFKTVDSNIRETSISEGLVDFYVGTYTINDERKQRVGFAGPYYTAGADLLVRRDDNAITGPTALKGKKVCSIVGSTPLSEIKKPKYGAETTELSKYSDCVKSLLDGQVDAVTTDDAILKGFAAERSSKLKVVGKPFTKEPYGVGMNKNDKVLRDAVTASLEKHIKNGDYKKAYEGTLGKSGSAYVAPETPLPRN